MVEHLHIAALHAHSQPLSSWTVAQGEDLQRGQNGSYSQFCASVEMCVCVRVIHLFYVTRLYLRGEVMLLQLPTLPQIPGAHSVIKTARPKLSAIMRYVNTAGTIRVTLKLPAIKVRKRANSY